MEDFKELWKKALVLLKEEISEVSYKTWISPIKPLEMDENTLTLGVPHGVNKNMIFTKYFSLIQNSLEVISSRQYQIEVIVFEEQKNVNKTETGQFNVNPKYTFATFVVGNNNSLAHAASMAVAESPASTYNPLFLYGGSGLGKTHLLHAVANHVLANMPDKKIMYITSEKFTNDLIESIKKDTNQAFRNKYRQVDLLLVDDIQFIAGRERTQEEFFHTFNSLYEAEKQIILTSDRLPSEIPQLEERLKTRFQMGLIADVQPPDFETRVAILTNKVQTEYLSVSSEILEYVADSIKSNVRDLEGAVKRMLAYTGIERTNEITMELAERALKEILIASPRRQITCNTIILEVEKYFSLAKNSLISQKRSRDVAYPRQIAMYIAREIVDISFPQIGASFGGRDHSTVMHNVNKIKREVVENNEVKECIDEIVKNLEKN